MTLYCENVPTPVGTLCVCSDGEAVTGIRFGAGETNGGCPVTGQARQQLTEYFAGQRREFDLPLAPAGTDFQRRVWELLREIPYGETGSWPGGWVIPERPEPWAWPATATPSPSWCPATGLSAAPAA